MESRSQNSPLMIEVIASEIIKNEFFERGRQMVERGTRVEVRGRL